MTAENNGTGATDGNDPFGYLYRSEGGTPEGQSGRQPQAAQRRSSSSYHHVRPVGQRQYGTATAPPTPQQTDSSGSPSAHYAAPETLPGGRAASRRQTAPAGRGIAGNRNGLLIGAIAVVGAVVIGIGSAIVFNDDNVSDATQNASTPTAPASEEPGGQGEAGGTQEQDEEKEKAEEEPLPSTNAASLRLTGGPSVQAAIKGAKADGGSYVGGMEKPGATAEWKLEVPKAGEYTVYVTYGVPGKDANATLGVNGEPQTRPLNMKNFANAKEGDWAKGWTETWADVVLKKGVNTLSVSCGAGNQCAFVLDRMWLEPGHRA